MHLCTYTPEDHGSDFVNFIVVCLHKGNGVLDCRESLSFVSTGCVLFYYLVL